MVFIQHEIVLMRVKHIWTVLPNFRASGLKIHNGVWNGCRKRSKTFSTVMYVRLQRTLSHMTLRVGTSNSSGKTFTVTAELSHIEV